MRRYNPNTPRATVALVAVALTILTLALSVVAPAKLDASAPQLAAAAPAAVATSDVQDAPARVERIDVVAVRDAKLTAVPGRAAAKRKNEG